MIIICFKLEDFERQRRQLNEKLTRKDNELDVVRHELNQVKEFRKKKAQMQQELEEVNLYNFFLILCFDDKNSLDKRCYVMECSSTKGSIRKTRRTIFR